MDIAYRGFNLFRARHVTDKCRRRYTPLSKIRDDFISPSLVEVHDSDHRALVCQPVCDRFTDISASTGDNRNLPVMTHLAIPYQKTLLLEMYQTRTLSANTSRIVGSYQALTLNDKPLI